jgi:hypothetical protein
MDIGQELDVGELDIGQELDGGQELDRWWAGV